MTEFSGTRDRLVQAAFELFSERGYVGTTVAELEEAAGLSPGAGGFYRHFESKAEVLEAVVEVQIRRTLEVESIIDQMLPLNDVRAEGMLLIRRGMEEMSRSQDVLMVLTRVSDEFPELLERFQDQIIQRAYNALSGWMEDAIEGGHLRVDNPTALMVIVVGAMANYRKTEALFDRPPAGVDKETFEETLLDVILQYDTVDEQQNEPEDSNSDHDG